MTPTRKPPHCKTCHKPLKGHKRGVCDTTTADTLTPPTPPHSPHSSSVKKPRKSAPHPLEPLPSLSPDDGQILNNILRKTSFSAPPIQIPVATRRSPRVSRSGIGPVESLQASMSLLSASDVKVRQGVSEGPSAPTEIDESEDTPEVDTPEMDGNIPSVPTQISTSSGSSVASQKFAPEARSAASTSLSHTTSSFAVFQEIVPQGSDHSSSHLTTHQSFALDLSFADPAIQSFLDSIFQGSRHPPATIFSFPKTAIPSLKDGAGRLGLFVYVLVTPTSKDDSDWTPVVVGRDMDAIAKLLEDSEKVIQDVRGSGVLNVPNSFGLGMSHVVIGTLGALATWAGLAYT